MEHQLFYETKPGDAVIRFCYQTVRAKEFRVPSMTMIGGISPTEGYYDIEYPVRTAYLKQRLQQEIPYCHTSFDQVYTPFEKTRVDLSAFISTPHQLSTYAITYFDCQEQSEQLLQIETCGGMRIWVNGTQQVSFDPFSRNHGQSELVKLTLQAGTNEIVVYFDDLAERDVNYYFSVINRGKRSIHGHILLPYEVADYQAAESFLYGLSFTKDLYRQGEIEAETEEILQTDRKLRLRINPPLYEINKDAQDGNITEFSIADSWFVWPAKAGKFNIGSVESFPTAGLTTAEFGIDLGNGQMVTRRICFSVYDDAKYQSYCRQDTIRARKKEALTYFSELELPDINVLLCRLYLGKPVDLNKFSSALSLIAIKGDCADFIFAPLLSLYRCYPDRFPEELQHKIQALALGFRYWIDEPGNDVMWYFSENHALLFHVAQYMAGALYPDQTFSVSGRSGSKQYEIGRQRIYSWFERFHRYGLSEWNSTTYLPIDFIGLFSLYLGAPDQEIRDEAKKSLDFIFKVIAINFHGQTLSSTFGRVYEHNLKAMQLGEISNISAIAWGRGWFNNALRASALFAIADYEPPSELVKWLSAPAGQAVKAEYRQGESGAYTYLFKTQAYSLASVIHYHPGLHGEQQHVLNISLGDDGTLLWLTNPGETQFSGENRPSFWAGNNVLPDIRQYNHTAFLHYDLQDTWLQFIHLYLPFWALDEVCQNENWLFIRKGNAYLRIWFSNGYEIQKHSAVRGREVRSYGSRHTIIVECGQGKTTADFKAFRNIPRMPVVYESELTYRNEQGQFIFSSEGLSLSGQAVTYLGTYEVTARIE